MKKVFQTTEIPHLFANKAQSEARNPQDNLFFNTDYNGNMCIYSYGQHFAVAKHVINEQGQSAVLFTTRGYSKTTSAHISAVEYACNHLNIIYVYDPNGYKADNLNEFLKEVNTVIYLIEKAKQQRTKLKEFTELERIKEKVNKYCNFLSIDLKAENLELFEALNSSDFNELLQFSEKQKEIQEKAKAAKEAKQLADHKTSLKKWRSFTDKYALHRATLYTRAEKVDYLRFNKITERVETSQGIEVPAKIAKSFYTQILEIVKTGKCNLCGSKFMEHYEIKEINKEFIEIGCHTIKIKEIKKLADSLGW